jgi:putative long chain acyl-CoA synthase
VPTKSGDRQIPCAAVTLRKGHEVTPDDLQRALADLGDGGIPLVVRVVKEIPLTTWSRPQTGPLRKQGLPAPTKKPTAWYWDPRKGGYRKLSKAAVDRLLAGRG